MTTGKHLDQGKERLWRQRMRDWQDSGLTIRAFCARCGLSPRTFYAWRRDLQRRDAAHEQPPFVPIRLLTDDAPAASAQALEVLVGQSRRIRVAPGFDAATLRQLLAVLEEGTPC